VTARFPERDGEFEYHIRSASDIYERMARESELGAINDDAAPKTDGEPNAKL
jgi:hypothetical protein